MASEQNQSRRFVDRRRFLFEAGGGLSGLALATLLGEDNLLGASAGGGCLTGGPMMASPFTPKQPHFAPRAILESTDKGIWRQTTDGPGVWRRSVYVYRKRGLPLPFFEVFDLPDQNVSCGVRPVSTVATQALTLLHNEWILNQARRFADRIATEAPSGPAAQVERAYLLALSREPSADEKRVGVEFLAKNTLNDFAHVLLNLNEFIYLR